jgi:hypothetical protein
MTSQFLSVDPIVDVTGTPYAYTGGDPINGTDPNGLDEEPVDAQPPIGMGDGAIGLGGIEDEEYEHENPAQIQGLIEDELAESLDAPDTARALTPGCEASQFGTDELARFAYEHGGGDDVKGKPSDVQIERAIRRGEATRLPGQNAVRFTYRGVKVIINEDLPTRSTASFSRSR